MITAENFVYWLSGFMTAKESLTEKDVLHVKIVMSELQLFSGPDKAQVTKMVRSLFPDVEGQEFENLVNKIMLNQKS